jgi:hypothetical protein
MFKASICEIFTTKLISYAVSEVLTAAFMQCPALCDITLCTPLRDNLYFGKKMSPSLSGSIIQVRAEYEKQVGDSAAWLIFQS